MNISIASIIYSITIFNKIKHNTSKKNRWFKTNCKYHMDYCQSFIEHSIYIKCGNKKINESKKLN
ncbi:hypothetical protein PVMG_05598 [Plasmodium vivax Mauritania I]|uniref:Uncharacterized protein n=1 Tax=Plasmodium vivax Mauritania I TaxID=1035515 RepID=A0A0J9TJ10_PLAVI|nr:hypothetical protein PVMG_05598 [Plasmodium vivax Mauritania I]